MQLKFSFNFLNDFIDLSDFFNKPHNLFDKLSHSGFEVEEWTKKKINDLVIAEVRSKRSHPSADRLSLCQVFSGQDKLHSIVCGADNFKEGDKVVLALPGAVLPGPFKIKIRKIRGELSEGMLVSLGELGFMEMEEDKGGIIVLPSEVRVGTDFSSYARLNDIIFDIDITPNRADCLSHFGLARELSCILNRPCMEFINPGKEDFSDILRNSTGSSIQKCLGLEVNQPKLCRRYTGRAIYGVKVKPSPLWLRVCLENLGLKSINNIVDVTNYFLIQWGQPLHAFDLDILKEKIVVDFSREKEKFQTLDNQEIILSGKELCIRDRKEPLALAGVIGGVKSGIHSNTKNIFLESACFEPTQVRRTSKRFHIETDSSYLFSRGVSSENTLNILHKALVLIQNMTGGEFSPDEYDIRENTEPPKPIEIQKKNLEKRLGMEVSFKKFQDWMKRLGCVVQSNSSFSGLDNSPTHSATDDRIKITPPYFRFDLKIKEDLIEEYARLEGYDKIPEKISYLSTFPKPDQNEHTVSLKIARILVHEGFYQAINHSFISRKFSDSFLNPGGKFSAPTESSADSTRYDQSSFSGKLLEKSVPVIIQNPLSAEYNMMRVSLAPSLFKNAQRSIRHERLYGRLFELGKVFSRFISDSESKQSDQKKNGYKESSYLGLVAWGQEEDLWLKPRAREGDFSQSRSCIYDLKTALNSLLAIFGVCDYKWIVEEKDNPSFIHPSQYMVLKVGGKTVAYIGSLNPLYAETYKIRVNMALAEINTQFLMAQNIVKMDFQNLSPFPVVERDLSFLVPKDFPADNIVKEIKNSAGPVCRKVRIFDIYENEQTCKENTRSISFRLTLQSDKKTLAEEDLKKLQDKLTKKLTDQYPIKLRAFSSDTH